MYCPKCKENFEEGSRRFCPTDGSRLISELMEAKHESGIFSGLLPKIGSEEDGDETLSETPRFVAAASSEDDDEIELELEDPDGMFFEFDDLPAGSTNETDFLKPLSIKPMPPDPVGRKVDPKEIPAGHVELDKGARAQVLSAGVDVNDPESFVGRIVKGRYKIREYLGGDESGLAYLAEDRIVLDKLVLVRILLQTNNDEILDSILSEERVALSHFSHPNTSRLIDSGQFANGTNFLISEYIDALSIRDVISIHGQINESRTARIIRQVAYALSEAHQEGILHRDLRPENIIVSVNNDDSEQVKLVNFGASNGEFSPRNIAYKALEVLSGRITTSASDNFSLAIVAYEMLKGELPFNGNSPREIIRSQNSGVPAGSTASLNQVFKKALSVNPAERYTKARDFGDALFAALNEAPASAMIPEATDVVAPADVMAPAVEEIAPDVEEPTAKTVSKQILSVPAAMPAPGAKKTGEPAWKNRSPEPPQTGVSRTRNFVGIGILVLCGLVALGWFLFSNRPGATDTSTQTDQSQSANIPAENGPVNSDIDVPPPPRNITAPANSAFFQNSRENLKGDLYRNFVGFSVYYPKDWTVHGPQEGKETDSGTRGKFLDISRSTEDGFLQEQMLVSYYPSKGTFGEDAIKFSEMVKETNETLKKILPGYQMVSEGETKVNGAWRAYEVKFQGSGTSAKGEKLTVWGRRLFIPAARPGVRDGFSVTMLATSNAQDIHSVDDVGVKGELAGVLETFEPSQNF